MIHRKIKKLGRLSNHYKFEHSSVERLYNKLGCNFDKTRKVVEAAARLECSFEDAIISMEVANTLTGAKAPHVLAMRNIMSISATVVATGALQAAMSKVERKPK